MCICIYKYIYIYIDVDMWMYHIYFYPSMVLYLDIMEMHCTKQSTILKRLKPNEMLHWQYRL